MGKLVKTYQKQSGGHSKFLLLHEQMRTEVLSESFSLICQKAHQDLETRLLSLVEKNKKKSGGMESGMAGPSSPQLG